jgi:hypothetical protein
MADFAVVRRYTTLEEARVAFSFLRSSGIAAELDHHHMCSNVWLWGGAVGVWLSVPAADATDASAALAQVDRGEFQLPDVPALERSWVTRLKAAVLFVLYLDPVVALGCASVLAMSLWREHWRARSA